MENNKYDINITKINYDELSNTTTYNPIEFCRNKLLENCHDNTIKTFIESFFEDALLIEDFDIILIYLMVNPLLCTFVGNKIQKKYKNLFTKTGFNKRTAKISYILLFDYNYRRTKITLEINTNRFFKVKSINILKESR